jgi:hypothetical protein
MQLRNTPVFLRIPHQLVVVPKLKKRKGFDALALIEVIGEMAFQLLFLADMSCQSD